MSTWPGSNDYTEAIQSPHLCFRDLDLKCATVEPNKRTRMPKVSTGNFAQVYELKNATNRWAVKCFTRSGVDLRTRYSELSKAITGSQLPYFIDFRFIDDEMLVNGKRHPIVKMQWVDGQSLDKFIESNLYQPLALLSTASLLLKMVRDLEEQKLAHGDLQHGNIVITSGGLKLVDYDGMFVPSFSGKAATEAGLPSYQHPRRGAADFGVGLDRFALLVICTGLCAVSTDPSLWYEFNNGENLLFTAGDFKDPRSSKLFQRLSSTGDTQLQAFVSLLKTACGSSPLGITLPEGAAISHSSNRRQAPWWVSNQASSRVLREVAGAQVRTISETISEFRHVGAAALTAVGAMSLVLAGSFSTEVGLLTGLIGFLGFMVDRVKRYTALPPLLRRRHLQTRLKQLRLDLQNHSTKKQSLEQQVVALTQQESAERGEELKRLRESHVSAYLATIPISHLMNISGIGQGIVGNFQQAGVHNAQQLKQRPYVQGVGTKRRSQILGLLAQWEGAAAARSPNALPPNTEAHLTGMYRNQRMSLRDQIAALTHEIAKVRSDTSQAEWATKQLHVPTFAQFLNNTF